MQQSVQSRFKFQSMHTLPIAVMGGDEIKENPKCLKSIIKIEPEELQDPNENQSQWTSADETLRKKAKM